MFPRACYGGKYHARGKRLMMGLRPMLPWSIKGGAFRQKKAPMWKHRDFGIWI